MKRIIFSGIFLLIVVAVFFSCKDENIYIKYRKEELKLLETFIAEFYPDIKPKPSGLYFIETQKGYGDTIKVGDKVHIYYSTWAIGDSASVIKAFLIDERHYDPYEVIVGSGGSGIVGLEEGLTYMQPGAKADLVINSNLAYGQNSNGTIPGFTTLWMAVEVYKVYPYKTSN